MTLKEFQLSIYKQNQKDYKPYIEYMMKQYTMAQADIMAEMEKYYLKYLQTVDPQDYYNIMIQHDRLNKLLTDTQIIYNEYAKSIGQTIKQVGTTAMANTYYRQQYVLKWIAPELSFTMLNPKLIDLSVSGTVKAWKEIYGSLASKYLPINSLAPQYGTLSGLLYNHKTQDLIKLQQAITNGMITGASYQDMSRNIQQLMDNYSYQSTRIAITETARLENQAAQLASLDAANQGINLKRMWLSSHSIGVHRHAAWDTEITEVDKPFHGGVMRPGAFKDAGNNINCQCNVITLTVRADGTIDKPELRRGKNPVTGKSEIYDFISFKEWAAQNGVKQNKYGVYYAA